MKKKALDIIENKMTRDHSWSIKNDWQLKKGTKEAVILDVRLSNKWGLKRYRFKTGEEVNVEVTYEAKKEIVDPHFGIAIFRNDYVYCYGPNTIFDGVDIERLRPGRGSFSIKYSQFLLLPGEYYISVAIWNPDESSPYDYHCACYKLEVIGKKKSVLYKEMYVYKYDMFNRKQNVIAESEISLMLVNKYGDEKRVFKTDDVLNFILKYKNNNISQPKSPFRIYREDGVLCFEMDISKNKRLNRDTKRLRLEIPRLHLLAGVYHVYLGSKKIKEFLVHSDKQDHGIVYMPHKWSIKIPQGGLS